MFTPPFFLTTRCVITNLSALWVIYNRPCVVCFLTSCSALWDCLVQTISSDYSNSYCTVIKQCKYILHRTSLKSGSVAVHMVWVLGKWFWVCFCGRGLSSKVCFRVGLLLFQEVFIYLHISYVNLRYNINPFHSLGREACNVKTGVLWASFEY